MRESNVSVVWNNRASVTINTVLYDRRALDCDSEMALMNSLSHLAYLTSTSPKIREILTIDGGLVRLMNILRAGRGQTFARMTIWQLALQCVVNVGIRGSEAIRIRVVEAGIVPIVVTLLDDFLFALESVVPSTNRTASTFTSVSTPPPNNSLAPLDSNSMDAITENNSPLNSLYVGGDLSSPYPNNISGRRNVAVEVRDSNEFQNRNRSTNREDNGREFADTGSSQGHSAVYSQDAYGDSQVQSPFTIQRLPSSASSTSFSNENINPVSSPSPSSPSMSQNGVASRDSSNSDTAPSDRPNSLNLFTPLPVNPLNTVQEASRVSDQLSMSIAQQQAIIRRRRAQRAISIPTPLVLFEARRLENTADFQGITSFFDNFDKKINKLPREEDILYGLQILAYTSKNYFHLRPHFEISKDVPSLRMSPLRSGNKVWNTFQLVEQFTLKFYPPQIQYWARAIMNNYCRKDESRGGIRRCASLQCNKWEEHSRQFAKCRRCRRTKYCSKECQQQAWPGHSRWCRVIHKDARSSRREVGKQLSQVPGAGVESGPVATNSGVGIHSNTPEASESNSSTATAQNSNI
ncbi:zf-MYND type zinc finger protein [Schizosaccharomyces cryophilus OY26]|uniref:Zf-MYND type zinc finger protein n=1 Tax=Schizosaccharomyces cryophilus (strain OY26 / ATCC MYA-4695 / CBS 11777 / NBRC 106824 / NRRL Y48691) TaxID=653667 RepID=S9X8Z1_SCHCR|nr:zf-MYND type zinc finger protein [Schizosaccharomyces cryophilus OY26]EPY53667.1 zf-MYND type zinc finger protein [Schizosaccharomyces cryophilus OY26]